MLRRIFSYMKQYKKYAYLALFCIAVEVVLELMVPLIMADLIDTGVANQTRCISIRKVYRWSAVLLRLYFLE